MKKIALFCSLTLTALAATAQVQKPTMPVFPQIEAAGAARSGTPNKPVSGDTEQIRANIMAVGGAEKFVAQLAKVSTSKLPLKTNSPAFIMDRIMAKGTGIAFSLRSTIDPIDPLKMNELISHELPKNCYDPIFSVLMKEHGTKLEFAFFNARTQFVQSFVLDAATCQGLKTHSTTPGKGAKN